MQIKFSFDKETVKKIAIGALIAGSASVMIFLLTVLSGYTFSNVELNAFIALVVPTLIYLVKKWRDGKIEIKKVLISMGMALSGAGVILLGGTHLTPMIDALIALVVPTILNTIKEYMAGEIKNEYNFNDVM